MQEDWPPPRKTPKSFLKLTSIINEKLPDKPSWTNLNIQMKSWAPGSWANHCFPQQDLFCNKQHVFLCDAMMPHHWQGADDKHQNAATKQTNLMSRFQRLRLSFSRLKRNRIGYIQQRDILVVRTSWGIDSWWIIIEHHAQLGQFLKRVIVQWSNEQNDSNIKSSFMLAGTPQSLYNRKHCRTWFRCITNDTGVILSWKRQLFDIKVAGNPNLFCVGLGMEGQR